MHFGFFPHACVCACCDYAIRVNQILQFVTQVVALCEYELGNRGLQVEARRMQHELVYYYNWRHAHAMQARPGFMWDGPCSP